jgi:hypothetical protein
MSMGLCGTPSHLPSYDCRWKCMLIPFPGGGWRSRSPGQRQPQNRTHTQVLRHAGRVAPWEGREMHTAHPEQELGFPLARVSELNVEVAPPRLGP